MSPLSLILVLEIFNAQLQPLVTFPDIFLHNSCRPLPIPKVTNPHLCVVFLLTVTFLAVGLRICAILAPEVEWRPIRLPGSL